MGNIAKPIRLPGHRTNKPPCTTDDDPVISCQQLIDFCVDYLDGGLPTEEEVRFRRHLSQCPDCVAFFETYRKTPQVTRVALETAMPASVKSAVRAFLRHHR